MWYNSIDHIVVFQPGTGVSMNKRNPLSTAAITHDEVRTGTSFICYKPGCGDRPLVSGTFVSEPEYRGDEIDGCWKVEVDLGESIVEMCLDKLGITPDRTGERWHPVISIYPDQSESN